MKPIFIMSSERSGSNLVREMLNAHPNISAPPAAQLPHFLSTYRHYYGDLEVDASMRRMIADALAVNQSHPEGLKISASVETIFAALTERSVWGLIAALYALDAQAQGKTAWASKDNFLFDFAFAIHRTLPDARFIYLFRDGRDYACSMRNVGWSSLPVYQIAKQWQKEQQACLQTYYTFKGAGRAQLLRYEDLLTEPERELRKLCEFLDEPFAAEMLNFHTGSTAKKLAAQSAFWQNLNKPVMKTNFAKFKKELTAREIALFESVAGRELAWLGYPRVTAAPLREPSKLLRLWYQLLQAVANSLHQRIINKREPWRQPRAAAIDSVIANLVRQSAGADLIEPLVYE